MACCRIRIRIRMPSAASMAWCGMRMRTRVRTGAAASMACRTDRRGCHLCFAFTWPLSGMAWGVSSPVSWSIPRLRLTCPLSSPLSDRRGRRLLAQVGGYPVPPHSLIEGWHRGYSRGILPEYHLPTLADDPTGRTIHALIPPLLRGVQNSGSRFASHAPASLLTSLLALT